MEITAESNVEYNDNSTTDEEATPLLHSNVIQHPHETPSALWKNSNLRSKLLLVNLLIVEFLSFLAMGSPTPFLARVVTARGGTIFDSAAIMQVMMLSVTIFSFVFAKVQIHIGSKALYISGITIFGMSQVFLGCLDYVHAILPFTIIGIFLNILCGIGDAALASAMLTIACREYSNHITKVMGFFEGAAGIGYLSGPVLGGIMYDAGGLILPFSVSGGILLLCVPIQFLVVTSDHGGLEHNMNRSPMEITQLCTKPLATIILISVASVFGIIGYMQVALTTYLKTLGFTPTMTGLVFLTAGIAYAVFALIAGHFATSRGTETSAFIIVGSVVFASTTLLFTTGQKIWFIFVSASLFGASAASFTIPTLEYLLVLAAEEQDVSDLSIQTYNVVTGTWYAFLGLGAFLLPILGGILQTYVTTFKYILIIFSLLQYVMTILLLVAVTVCRN